MPSTPILETRDRTVLALPQTSFSGGAALPGHEAVLADLGMHADSLIVPPGSPHEILSAQAQAVRRRVAEALAFSRPLP